ncbi:Gfo/Idh/MocA family protein [Kaistia adipata]|uniref:Gfo/Idh/MocA family protein n=1 Tax=Kaistia adipata TaxID=166954 RepID=UPI000A0788E8|nr:Gfo/Idh/MocA family oxidoreductase [Kaistia adipata]
MTDRRVKTGIIGAGIWGSNHALALSTHPQCELSLICDLDGARAKALAERVGCGWTDNIDTLANSDVEAVTIATPDPFHREPTVAMFEAGKHVMCEKPLATTVADGLAMVAAAEKAGTKFMVDFHARWYPLFMGAKGYAERGELGDPVMAYARLSDTIYVPTKMLKWGGNSGPEWFLFPHTMDLVRWIFGREPVSVYAQGHRGVLDGMGINSWDTIQSMVTFEGGAFCTFETSWILPESFTNVVDNRLTVYGTKGGLELRNEPSLWVYTDRYHTPFASESITRYGKVAGGQYDSIRYFIDCVAEDITPEASGHDGLIATAMIEATLLSLAEKRPVTIAEIFERAAVQQ